MMALSGVRISWLIIEMKSALALAACSARCRARSSSRSYSLRSVALKTVVRTSSGLPAASFLSTELISTGSRLAVGADHLDRDLAHRPLHPQQRRVVRLVEDPAAGGEQVLEPPAADEVLPPVAGPGQEGLVDLDDEPAGERREIAAGGVLVEVLGVLLEQTPAGALGILIVDRPRFIRLEEGLDGGDGLFRSAQVGAVAGRLQQHQLAVRDLPVHVLAHRLRSDGVVGALQDQRAGPCSLGRSARLSERKVTRAKCCAISGSVRQKLLVSSSPSSGRSGLPMITGAMALDQPR